MQKAIDKTDQSVVAIKIIAIEADISDLIKEIDILQQCKCDEIVAYKGAYEKDGELWIVMVRVSRSTRRSVESARRLETQL